MTTGNQTQFAQWMDVKQPYVSQLKKAGRLVEVNVDGNVLIDFEASRDKIEATKDPAREDNGQNAKAHHPASGSSSPLQEAKAKDAFYTANLRELEYNKQAGKLIDKSSHDRAAFTTARILRDALVDNLPTRISQELASLTDPWQVECFLRDQIRAELKSICDKLETEAAS